MENEPKPLHPVEKSVGFYGEETETMPLPFPKPFTFPAYPTQIPVLPTIFQESCGIKIVQGVALGAILGFGMGMFLGLMGDVSPIQILHGREVPQAALREQMRVAVKMTVQRSISWSKSFASVTAIFSGTECVVEKYRGKHDVWNSMISGCIAGAALSASQGPQAACLGCVGFAAFSAVAEKVMGHD